MLKKEGIGPRASTIFSPDRFTSCTIMYDLLPILFISYLCMFVCANMYFCYVCLVSCYGCFIFMQLLSVYNRLRIGVMLTLLQLSLCFKLGFEPSNHQAVKGSG